MTNLRASFYDHARDNLGTQWTGTPAQLQEILGRTQKPSSGNPGGTPKQSMPAFSGAFYPPGVTRGLGNASGVQLLTLDFDNSVDVPTGEFFLCPRTEELSNRPKMRKVRIDQPVTLNEVAEHLRSIGVAFSAWSTWSSTQEHQKFRVVIFLSRPVAVSIWGRAVGYALSILELGQFQRGLDMPVVLNPVALAFCCGSPDPSTIRKASSPGNLLEIHLSDLPPAAPPALAPWQTDLVADRKAELQAGGKWWSGYRVGGRPVDFQALDLTALLVSLGIKVGRSSPFKNGTKTRVWCPWSAEHSGHRDGDDAVVITTPGTWPSFRCEHSGHRHLGLRDLIEWAWGRP